MILCIQETNLKEDYANIKNLYIEYIKIKYKKYYTVITNLNQRGFVDLIKDNFFLFFFACILFIMKTKLAKEIIAVTTYFFC